MEQITNDIASLKANFSFLETRLTILETRSEERHKQSEERHQVTYSKLDALNKEISYCWKDLKLEMTTYLAKADKMKDEVSRDVRKDNKDYVNLWLGIPVTVTAIFVVIITALKMLGHG